MTGVCNHNHASSIYILIDELLTIVKSAKLNMQQHITHSKRVRITNYLKIQKNKKFQN